jgi:5-(aminomethyl)-3-furanmethanol phosphate kinase
VIVVKVGGSLYDLPDLGERLRRFLASLAGPRLVVPGGGATADVVRAFDRDHGLGPTVAHWLALRACAMNAWFLRELLPTAEVVADPRACGLLGILDLHAFAQDDEGRAGCLPHVWSATSDSVAARVAEVASAELVLLKSVDIAGDWERAAQEGLVDPVFPEVVARAALRVRAVNLRTWAG